MPTLTAVVPDSATGPAADLRAQTRAALQGEKLAVPDGEVASAGDIPVEVIQHGKQYLGAVPEYGPGLEQMCYCVGGAVSPRSVHDEQCVVGVVEAAGAGFRDRHDVLDSHSEPLG